MNIHLAAVVVCVVIGAVFVDSSPLDDALRSLLARESGIDRDWAKAVVALAKDAPSKRAFVDRLLGFFHDADDRVRRGAVAALAEFPAEAAAAVPAVLSVLEKDADPWVRQRAVRTLQTIDSANMVKHFSVAAKDPSADVRAAVIQAVKWDSPSAVILVPDLRQLLMDDAGYFHTISADMAGSRPVKYEAILALDEVGDKAQVALPELRRLLNSDPNPEVRLVAAVAVARLDPKDTSGLQYLMKQAEHAEWEFSRSDAVFWLSQLRRRAQSSAPLLKRLVKSDPSSLVRFGCALAFPKVNGPGQDTVAVLIEALGDPDSDVQLATLESLEKLGHHAANAAEAVERTLNRYVSMPDEEVPYSWRDIRIQAAKTLLAIGDPKTVAPIIEKAADRAQTETIRAEIRELLKNKNEGKTPEGNRL